MEFLFINRVGCAQASNDYKWSSSDMSTVSVSASGVVQAKKPGKATVKVQSVYDSLNYDEVIKLGIELCTCCVVFVCCNDSII